MSLTTSDIIIVVVATVLTFMTVVLVIQEAEKQMYVFGIRPSESVSTDIAGLITLTKGIPGEFTIEYKPQLKENVNYNVTIKNQIVCVSSTTRYSVSDCASTAFSSTDSPEQVNASDFTLQLIKTQPGLEVKLSENI